MSVTPDHDLRASRPDSEPGDARRGVRLAASPSATRDQGFASASAIPDSLARPVDETLHDQSTPFLAAP